MKPAGAAKTKAGKAFFAASKKKAGKASERELAPVYTVSGSHIPRGLSTGAISMLYIVLCLTAALIAFAYFRRNSLTLWIAAVMALSWSVELCAGAAWNLIRDGWVRVFGA